MRQRPNARIFVAHSCGRRFASVAAAETHRPFPGDHTQDDPERVKLAPYLPETPETQRDVAALNAKIRDVESGALR